MGQGGEYTVARNSKQRKKYIARNRKDASKGIGNWESHEWEGFMGCRTMCDDGSYSNYDTFLLSALGDRGFKCRDNSLRG